MWHWDWPYYRAFILIPEEQSDIKSWEGGLYFRTRSLYLKDTYLHFNVWDRVARWKWCSECMACTDNGWDWWKIIYRRCMDMTDTKKHNSKVVYRVGLYSHPIGKYGICGLYGPWPTVRDPVKLHLIVFCAHNCIWLENVPFPFYNFCFKLLWILQISRNVIGLSL